MSQNISIFEYMKQQPIFIVILAVLGCLAIIGINTIISKLFRRNSKSNTEKDIEKNDENDKPEPTAYDLWSDSVEDYQKIIPLTLVKILYFTEEIPLENRRMRYIRLHKNHVFYNPYYHGAKAANYRLRNYDEFKAYLRWQKHPTAPSIKEQADFKKLYNHVCYTTSRTVEEDLVFQALCNILCNDGAKRAKEVIKNIPDNLPDVEEQDDTRENAIASDIENLLACAHHQDKLSVYSVTESSDESSAITYDMRQIPNDCINEIDPESFDDKTVAILLVPNINRNAQKTILQAAAKHIVETV